MTSIEAALQILRESGKPMRAEELAALAVERELVPGARAVANMKSGLTRELKRGGESRVTHGEEERWWLAGAGAEAPGVTVVDGEREGERDSERDSEGEEGEGEGEGDMPAVPHFVAEAMADAMGEPDLDDDDDDDDDGFDTETAADTATDAGTATDTAAGTDADADLDDDDDDDDGDEPGVAPTADAPPGTEPAADAGRRRRRRGGRRRRKGRDQAGLPGDLQVSPEGARAPATAAVAPPAPAPEGEEDLDDDLAGEPEVIDPATLSEEERALLDVYGEDLAAAGPNAANAEYRDAQTADEDRPMLPEIASKRDRFGRRREERRGRDRDRPRAPGAPAAAGSNGSGAAAAESGSARPQQQQQHAPQPQPQPQQAREPAPPPAQPVAAAGPRPIPRGGRSELVAATETLLVGLNGQPTNVRQIGAMLRKRHLVEGDYERDWKLLKTSLLYDERQRRGHGLRPRIQYKGRDCFAAPPVESFMAAAEDALDRAVAALDTATSAALRNRLCKLRLPALERIVQLLLVQAGWDDLVWVKRAERMGYAVGRPPGGAPLLVGVCAGHDPIDRRPIGELRAGVEAKNLAAGLLYGPQEVSAEGWRELAGPGRALGLHNGHGFVSEVATAGIGVIQSAVPVTRVDPEFFVELVED